MHRQSWIADVILHGMLSCIAGADVAWAFGAATGGTTMVATDSPPPARTPGLWSRITSGLQPKDAITISISVIALFLTGLNFWWSNLRVHDEAYGYVTRAGPAKGRLAKGETSPMEIDLFIRNPGNRPISPSEAFVTLAHRHCEDDHVVEAQPGETSSNLFASRLDLDAMPFTQKPGEASALEIILPYDFFAGVFPQADEASGRDVVASILLTTMANDDSKHVAIFDCLFKVDPETNVMQPLNDYTFKNFPVVSLLGPAPK